MEIPEFFRISPSFLPPLNSKKVSSNVITSISCRQN